MPADPKIVMFCQIGYYNLYDFGMPEPPYVMMALAALKRLNFQVHATTYRTHSVETTYLCEHVGEGVQFDIVQNALSGICQDTLIPVTTRAFKSKDGNVKIRWVCG